MVEYGSLPPLPDVLTDDKAMDFTQQKRMQIISALTANGKLPEDVKEQGTLMKALDGIDKQALGKKRLVTEDKLADNQRETARLINDVLLKIGGTRMGEAEVIVPREAPQLPDSIPEPIIVDGELDSTGKPQTFDTFVATQRALEPTD